MKKELILRIEEGEYGVVCGHEVLDGEQTIFSAYNLCECPEDAIIGRDLFDANDYLSAVKYGIELAKNGYNEVELLVESEKSNE